MGLETYQEFNEYVQCKKAGLRKEALEHLDEFLEMTASWGTEDQRKFICFLFSENNTERRLEMCSFPLLSRLVIPVVLAWRDESSDNPIPYFAFADICTNLSGNIPWKQWYSLVGEVSMDTDDIHELRNWPQYMSAKKAMELAPDVIAYRIIYIEILIRYLEVIDHNIYSGFPNVPLPATELEDLRRQLEILPDSAAKKNYFVKRYQEFQRCFDEYKEEK